MKRIAVVGLLLLAGCAIDMPDKLGSNEWLDTPRGPVHIWYTPAEEARRICALYLPWALPQACSFVRPADDWYAGVIIAPANKAAVAYELSHFNDATGDVRPWAQLFPRWHVAS